MSTSNLHDRAMGFMAYLSRYKNDRGALANLRGGLSAARRQRAWPLLGGFNDAIGAIGNPVFEMVAAMWAGAPELDSPGIGNFGATLRRLAGDLSSFEGRFKRLLTCDTREEAVEHVAPVVRAAQAKGVKLDYTRLLSDLLWWGERVKVEWAQAFWGLPGKAGAGINPAMLDQAEPAAKVSAEAKP